jgi:hypothetical protein
VDRLNRIAPQLSTNYSEVYCVVVGEVAIDGYRSRTIGLNRRICDYLGISDQRGCTRYAHQIGLVLLEGCVKGRLDCKTGEDDIYPSSLRTLRNDPELPLDPKNFGLIFWFAFGRKKKRPLS